MENVTQVPTLEPPYTEVEPWLRGLHSTVALLLMVVSLGGNALVLWTVVRYKELQYRSILASMGAVAVNILLSATANPQVLAGSVTGEWPLGDAACNAVGYFLNAVVNVRWLNTFLIALDRFLYITTPFWYQRNSKTVLIVLTVLVWTVPFVTNIPSAVLKVYTYRSTFTFCSVDCSAEGTCYFTYIVLFSFYMFIGVLVPTIIYAFLYCYGKKKRCEMNRKLGTLRQEVDLNCAESPNRYALNNFSMRRPSTDLACINEEDETNGSTAVHDFAPSSSSSTSSSKESPGFIMSAPLEHKIIDVDKLQTGRRPSCDTVSTELDSTSAPHVVTHGNSSQDDNVTTTQDDLGERGSECNPELLTPQQTGCAWTQRRGSEDSRNSSTASNQPLGEGGMRRTSSVVVQVLSSLIPSRQQAVLQRRETQATITFAIIFTNLILTHAMLFFMSTIRRQEFYTDIPLWVHMIAVNLYLLAPALEPLIIIKNEDFKKVLMKVFRRRRRHRSFSLRQNTGHITK